MNRKNKSWKTTSFGHSIMGNQHYNGWCSHLGWAASFIKRVKLNYIFRLESCRHEFQCETELCGKRSFTNIASEFTTSFVTLHNTVVSLPYYPIHLKEKFIPKPIQKSKVDYLRCKRVRQYCKLYQKY